MGKKIGRASPAYFVGADLGRPDILLGPIGYFESGFGLTWNL